jgi:hypothetical protein
MRSQKRKTRERMDPTPVVVTPVEDFVPEGAPISDDDDSVVSSVYSIHSEPEGEFRDNFDDDGVVHVPEPPPAPNIHEGARPNVVPEGDDSVQAPEGAQLCQTHGPTCQYPPAKWIRGHDSKLERVNFCELRRLKALGKLNRDMFSLTLGTKQIPPGAHTMSKKKKRLKYKQYQRSLQSSGDALQMMSLKDSLPSISDLLNSPLSKYITLAANDCSYDATAEELIV